MEIPADRLKSFLDNIERLEAEKAITQETIKEIYDQAKGEGFDVPTLKKVARLRKMRKDELEEQDALLETYRGALGI